MYKTGLGIFLSLLELHEDEYIKNLAVVQVLEYWE